jgi:hypothetical protein
MQMSKDILMLTSMDSGIIFYHQSDERAFFEWLSRIHCVKSFASEGRLGLVVHLKHRPENDDLWQLLALCQRYGVNMQQLAKFETDENRRWFNDPKMYWYSAVFGHQ